MKYLLLFLTILLATSCGKLRGPAGSTGPTGYQGLPGADGADGVAGTDGTNGTDGDAGSAGPAGDTGPTGNTGTTGTQGVAGDTGPAGPTGSRGSDGSDLRFDDVQAFAGTWEFPRGGQLTIYSSDQRIYLLGAQALYSVNPTTGLTALHPAVHAGPHYLQSGKMWWNGNVNYSTTTNGVREDTGGGYVSGSHMTRIQMQVVDGRLTIELRVYDDEELVVTRILAGEQDED